ncbi:MAG: poly-gamma-glutamate system protein [Deltaproteobacteria bacterium]|nr:poly-gamma-glutamate system protein [Deltaproteobacteria bacterium]
MKKLYWRPSRVSRSALVLVAVLSSAAALSVESFPVERQQRNYREKLAASRLARSCMEAIKKEKLGRGLAIDREVDPAETGMIGPSITPVTANTGYIDAKLTSTNPNFAAVVVQLLRTAGVQEGDTVAVGFSGSFPALNVATCAAIETLRLRPIAIASVSASTWGATDVDYLWLDMERTLERAGLVSFRSEAATRGGIDDRGVGMTKEGRALLDAAMERSGVMNLKPSSLGDAIAKRMAFYEEKAAGRPIKAYINIGGGSASVGTHVGKKQFSPGLNREPPRVAGVADSVMLRFVKQEVPVIHLSRIKLLAERFGLPLEPRTAVPVGQGKVFKRAEYNRWLALGAALAILGAMVALLRFDLGLRLLRSGEKRPAGAPEPMV